MANSDIFSQPVGIIGTGVAGLINAHVLLQDGFTDVTLISRDKSVGGTWARERVYPGLHINNVHGEYKLSPLEMPPPERSDATGGRLTGIAMRDYMETFSKVFLEGKANFRLRTEVLKVKREKASSGGSPGTWIATVRDLKTGDEQDLSFNRVIGCSNPKVLEELSETSAKKAGYPGLVFHTSKFAEKLDEVLEFVKPREEVVVGGDVLPSSGERVVVIGGGKSAQDVCAKLANEGRRVTIVFDRTDTFLAAPKAIPEFIRRSRRFLHTTWLGSKIVHGILDTLLELSFKAYNIPPDSPFRRNAHPLFWGVRLSDDGMVRNDSFYGFVDAGLIDVVAPHRVAGYSSDGTGVLLDDGTALEAKVVVLATGYQSSWADIFTKATVDEVGFGKHAPTLPIKDYWDCTSTKNGLPEAHPGINDWTTTIYRGIVPAKNLLHRDFALVGSLFTPNPGYTNEVVAHWVSSYFQGDKMKLPKTMEEAMLEAEKDSVWMKVRDSYSASLDFWTWPQAADDLLDDMHLPTRRSGGNWLTWPFKLIETKELSKLTEERRALPNLG
ncbi:FAD/NAD(P)-binding domain-containing protein [Coprinellus micaceus]|uniref:FAD/NAD(P)-binding domain-containing protein n=1 Tax=Coprinellus micaceus TaxID=71717 RepID=A0A4Y7T1Q0_COPMI|nr:FAD/NAD(P)-binding domain-containing protein [Coprinellus micaceus]